ncbi:MAG: hypothetical protein JNK82_13970 [Myxococcaceae bacterium]|nr:hypothetical protein [Myxococcaceae bacterium]
MRRLALIFLLAGCAGEIFTPRPSGSASGEQHGQEPKVERPPCTPSGDPGRVQLHRLNCREYNNDLWLTMMRAHGLTNASFGNSGGTLSEV